MPPLRRELKAHILRCLASTVENDADLGGEYLYEGVDLDDRKEARRRERMVFSLTIEIGQELRRRAKRLSRNPGEDSFDG